VAARALPKGFDADYNVRPLDVDRDIGTLAEREATAPVGPRKPLPRFFIYKLLLKPAAGLLVDLIETARPTEEVGTARDERSQQNKPAFVWPTVSKFRPARPSAPSSLTR
jgi:hypothetical protein